MYPDPHIRRRKRKDPQTKRVVSISLTRYKLTLRSLNRLPFRECVSRVTAERVVLIPPFRTGQAIKIRRVATY